MFKRVILMSLCAMLGTEAKAYNFGGTSLCLSPSSKCPTKTYRLDYFLTGGQQPGDTSIITGQVEMTKGFLICGTHGNQNDVSGGKGGITPVLSATDNQGAFDKRGRFILPLFFRNRVVEFASLAEFVVFWGLSNEDCRNPNWVPLEVRLQSGLIHGEIFRDCTDPNDTNTCAKKDDAITVSCETDKPLGDSVFTCKEVQ